MKRTLLLAALAAAFAACSGPERIETYDEPPHQAQRGVSYVPGVYDPSHPPAPYCRRVLSIDGGGMRGIIPAMVLRDLERRAGKPTAELFDEIWGTSTGGILALGLAKAAGGPDRRPEYTAAQMLRLYETEGKNIFPQSLGPFSSAYRSVVSFFYPAYSAKGLERVLERYFHDARFSEALVPVTVTAYEIEERRHYLLSSTGEPWMFARMRQVARATSAAPTYFTPTRIAVPKRDGDKGYRAFIDGGVFANNPARFLDSPPNTLLLSLGTGEEREPITYEKARRWGKARWLRPLLSIMFSDPGVDADIEDAMTYRKSRFVRLQPRLPPGAGSLDGARKSDIARLEAAGAQLIRDNDELLGYLAKELVRDRGIACAGPDR